LSTNGIFENFSDFRELKRIEFELFGGTLSVSIIVEVSLAEWASPTSGRWHVSSQQGTLTEREGLVQLTSSLRQLVLLIKLNLFLALKSVKLNWLEHGGLSYFNTEPSPSVSIPWPNLNGMCAKYIFAIIFHFKMNE
jgi:hypothetical protein